MALVSCRECGQQVSTEAAICPYCGASHPATTPEVRKRTLKRRIEIGLGILALMILVGGIAWVAKNGTLPLTNKYAACVYAQKSISDDLKLTGKSVRFQSCLEAYVSHALPKGILYDVLTQFDSADDNGIPSKVDATVARGPDGTWGMVMWGYVIAGVTF